MYSGDSEKPSITPPRVRRLPLSCPVQKAAPAESGSRPRTFWYTRSTNWASVRVPYRFLNSDDEAKKSLTEGRLRPPRRAPIQYFRPATSGIRRKYAS
jgi:hypothetical protein